MGNKLISIAMATYNGEKYIKQQLESIYNQNYKNIEVIVCDDCSTDHTVSILHEFRIKYNLKYYVNDKNLGFVKNFEKAVKLCNGEFIALSDQDDIWLPNKLEILLKEINECALICSDALLINSMGEVISGSFKEYQNISTYEGKPFKNLIYNNFVTGCTSLFKAELIKDALPIPENFGYHDWWLAIVATRREGIKYLNQQLVMYRQHDSNDTGAQKSETWIIKINRYISNKSSNKITRKKYYVMMIHSLEALLSSKLQLSSAERVFVQEAIKLYNDKLTSLLHYRSFSVVLKYQHYIFPNYNFINRQIATIGWLFN